MNPLITIAIPAYNNRQTIRRAVDSAISQSDLDSVEILVVDNASTDGTRDELHGISVSNFRLERNSSTVPIWHNHNVCFRYAKGSYVLFCHSDDQLDSDAIKVIKKALAARDFPKRYICWGHSLFRDFSQSVLSSGFRPGEMFAGLPATRPFLDGGLTPSGTLYSKEFLSNGGFFETENGIAPSDSTSMIWAALNGFRFEMLQELIFRRAFASTYVAGLSKDQIRQAMDAAWEPLLPKLSDSQLTLLLGQSQLRQAVSSEFYRQIYKRLPRPTARAMLLNALRRPLNLARRGYIWVLGAALYESLKSKRVQVAQRT